MRIRSLVLLFSGIVAGFALAAFWFGVRPTGDVPVQQTSANTAEAQVWICSMHPQIRMDHPGICPLCGMDLTLVTNDSGHGLAPDELVLSDYAQAMARVATVEISPRELVKELRTVGRVELDETKVAKISARVNGRVDQVFADFPGTPVRKGEHLVSIYSPDLVATQEEFLNAYRREQQNPSLGLQLSASARRRLQLWGITDSQINELIRGGKAETHQVVYAPMGGTVIEKAIRAGQYVKEGDVLYTIADLAQVWLILEVYESELAWIRVGQPVEVSLESRPHQPLRGTVGFVEPVLDQSTRTVKVRAIMGNRDGQLKPGMYAQAVVRVPILSDGRPAPTGLEGKYVCPMHPYEVSEEPGECSVCRMPLERLPGEPARASAAGTAPTSQVLAVPAEAVLTTGRRQLVYVEREPGKYQLVQPKLGPRAGDFYPVLDGLAQGDRVVVRGNFLLDSQYQVTGKPSLLYPVGTAGQGGHGEHGPHPKGPSAKELAHLDKLAPEDRTLALQQKTCPITGKPLGSMGTPYKMLVGDRPVFLCCKGCEPEVKKDPDKALAKLPVLEPAKTGAPSASSAGAKQLSPEEQANLDKLAPEDRRRAIAQRICPVTGEPLGSMGVPHKMIVRGHTVFLCCEGCVSTVEDDPDAALKKLGIDPAK